MASDWFEKDNLKRTVQQLLIDALTEMEVDFYRLDTVVQATLLERQCKSVSNVHWSRS